MRQLTAIFCLWLSESPLGEYIDGFSQEVSEQRNEIACVPQHRDHRMEDALLKRGGLHVRFDVTALQPVNARSSIVGVP